MKTSVSIRTKTCCYFEASIYFEAVDIKYVKYSYLTKKWDINQIYLFAANEEPIDPACCGVAVGSPSPGCAVSPFS